RRLDPQEDPEDLCNGFVTQDTRTRTGAAVKESLMTNPSLMPLLCRAVLSLALPLPVVLGLAGHRPRPKLTSHVTVMTADGKEKKVIYSAPRKFEAPNWSPDGKYLLLNSEGKLWRLPLAGGAPELIDTGTVKGINNDHGISPDGKLFAISA